MVAKVLIKKSFDYLTSNRDLLRSLKLVREFANRQQKKFGKKTQTLTKKSKLLYEGIPKPVGSTVMSHGRLRSYAMIKALQGRAPLGQRLRLSDYKRNVKPKKGRLKKASQKYELRNYKLPRSELKRVFRTKWEKIDYEGEKMLRAQKRLNEIRYKQSGSFIN